MTIFLKTTLLKRILVKIKSILLLYILSVGLYAANTDKVNDIEFLEETTIIDGIQFVAKARPSENSSKAQSAFEPSKNISRTNLCEEFESKRRKMDNSQKEGLSSLSDFSVGMQNIEKNKKEFKPKSSKKSGVNEVSLSSDFGISNEKEFDSSKAASSMPDFVTLNFNPYLLTRENFTRFIQLKEKILQKFSNSKVVVDFSEEESRFTISVNDLRTKKFVEFYYQKNKKLKN